MLSFKLIFAAAALLVAANAETVKITTTNDNRFDGVSPGYATFGGELVDRGSSYGDSKSGNKYAQVGKKGDDKSAQDDRNSGKYCKKNSAGMFQVSAVALAVIFGATLFMLQVIQVNTMPGDVAMPQSLVPKKYKLLNYG